jgi:hypothetical protein
MQLVKDDWKSELFASHCVNEKQTPDIFFHKYDEMYETLSAVTEHYEEIDFFCIKEIPTLDMAIINSDDNTIIVMHESINELMWNHYEANKMFEYDQDGNVTEQSQEDFDEDMSSYHYYYVNDVFQDLEIYFEKTFYHHAIMEWINGKSCAVVKNSPLVKVW